MRTVFFRVSGILSLPQRLSGHGGHSHNVAHSRAVMRQSPALRQPHGSLANCNFALSNKTGTLDDTRATPRPYLLQDE